MARANTAEADGARGGSTKIDLAGTATATASKELERANNKPARTGKPKLPRFTPRKSSALPAEAQHEDAWLDSLEEAPRQTGLRGIRDQIYISLGGTGRWMGNAWGFATTTVGKLLVMILALTLLLFTAGYVMSQASAKREAGLNTLITATEPMSDSAHRLYTQLSQADTLATTSFVQPGLETASSRRDYLATIDGAVVAADDVLRGSVETLADDTTEVQLLVREIQRQLPQYTGLMERAQANQRVGNPLGVAYMTQASDMMREDMLVSAERILQITRSQVGSEMNRLSSPQVVPIAGLVASLTALLAAQWLLWRMFRRRLNKGFLGATALVLVAIVWVGASNYGAWAAGTRDFQAAAGPYEQLTSARIAAQETRTDETLVLLTRRTAERSGATMEQTSSEVTAALDAVETEDNKARISDARDALADWRRAHTRMLNALRSGDYERAADIAASTANIEESATLAFRRLDTILTELIDSARLEIRSDINAGLAATRSVSAVVMILTVLAILCTWVGIRPRVQEYL